MSLTELSTAIPERLPAQLNFADLGTQFQAVTGKRSVHIQPSSGNTFSPDGIRVIRFITGLIHGDWLPCLQAMCAHVLPF